MRKNLPSCLTLPSGGNSGIPHLRMRAQRAESAARIARRRLETDPEIRLTETRDLLDASMTLNFALEMGLDDHMDMETAA